MARGKKHTPEQIVSSKLRQVEVAVANGKTTPSACREGRHYRADVLPLAQGIRWFAAVDQARRLERA